VFLEGRLTGFLRALTIEEAGVSPPVSFLAALPPRSMVGQLTLDQHIGVRIPGGQPDACKRIIINNIKQSEKDLPTPVGQPIDR
jgi:hypothetical protein